MLPTHNAGLEMTFYISWTENKISAYIRLLENRGFYCWKSPAANLCALMTLGTEMEMTSKQLLWKEKMWAIIGEETYRN